MIAITLDAEPTRGFVRLHVHGTLTVEVAQRTLREAMEQHPSLHRLWDFRDADLTAWSLDDMRGFIATVAREPGARAGTRVAALVSRDVDFGMARMFEALSAGDLPFEMCIFRDATAAEEWITRP